VDQLQESEEFEVHFEPPEQWCATELNASVARTIFAIVQEAVNNAKKHASPQDVWLRLSCDGAWLQVMVEDNGKGFDVESVIRDYDRKGSIGVLSMRERAELIDGLLELKSETQAPNSGTRVTLRVPLTDKTTGAAAPTEGRN
jgi:signal transduction histidine kinase